MLAGIYLFYCLSDASFRVYHIAYAARVPGRWIITGSVCHAYFSFYIAKQQEGKVELLGKGAVFFYGVEAYTKHFDVSGGVFLDSITESNAFGRSAGCIGLWVKP